MKYECDNSRGFIGWEKEPVTEARISGCKSVLFVERTLSKGMSLGSGFQ